MKIIIQKFGGTSVSTENRRVAAVNKIKAAIKAGYSPVVVVSAMGRFGEPYATDTLLKLLDNSFKTNNNKAVDLLMNCGEIISSVVFANELYKENIKATPLSGGQAGIITDDNFTNATAIKLQGEKLLDLLQKGFVPIVAGFQGVTEDGYFTTLGRGGSDTSAALLGAMLKADLVEIYTDVNGIMTADPKIVKEAKLIKKIDYNEVLNMADQGAKVIHPKAVDIVARYRIPMVIKNTLNDEEGTIIEDEISSKQKDIITAITHTSGRVQIAVAENIHSDRDFSMSINDLFNNMAFNKISIDLINVFPNKSYFTIDQGDFELFKQIADNFKISYTSIENCSKIAIIGSGMKGVPGVLARIMETLNNSGITVLQTADSHSTIWCLINNYDVEKAINSLHDEFICI